MTEPIDAHVSTLKVNDPEQLAAALDGVTCLLLDFDGPICSVFAGWTGPQVADWMRKHLARDGISLGATGTITDDPMVVLTSAAAESPAGQVRAEQLLQEAELRCVESATPTYGAAETMRAALDRGWQLAVVSNNSQPAIEAYLMTTGLLDGLSLVTGRDALDARLMKPHPHLVLTTLERLPASTTEAVLVGDSTTDIASARRAGIRSIGLANKPGKGASLSREEPTCLLDSMLPLWTGIARLR